MINFGLKHVRYFIAVAEELHFRRASERLRIAQPALSRAIQHLEHELGVRLFERTNRSVNLTGAGTAFLSGCRTVMNEMEHAIDNTRQVDRGQIGTLRIGYTDSAIAGVLPSLLKEFRHRQPGVVLQPHHGVTADQLLDLESGTLDIGFLTGPIDRQGYDQFPIQSERFICVVYENHRLAGRRSIRLEELAQEDFVHGPARDWEHFFYYLIPLCRQSGFIPRIVQEAFNSAGILGLVASGMGITILSESALNLARTGLVAIPIDNISERLMTVAIWKSNPMGGSKKRFVDYIRELTLPES
jgi:DNA-binding transcriptional LysR family regulator